MLRKQYSCKKFELNDFFSLKVLLVIHVLRDFQNLCKKYIALLLKRLHSHYRDSKTNHYNVMNDVLRNTLKEIQGLSQWGAGLGGLWQVRCVLTPYHSLLPSEQFGFQLLGYVMSLKILRWAFLCVEVCFKDIAIIQWKVKVKVKSLSRVQLFATAWTVAYQAPLSMGFSRQEYWQWVAISFSRGSSQPRDRT